MGIIIWDYFINHYKDPYQTASIMESSISGDFPLEAFITTSSKHQVIHWSFDMRVLGGGFKDFICLPPLIFVEIR